MAAKEAKLVSMERTAKEKTAAQKRMDAAISDSGPDYPYGLTINLGKDELKKLGIDDLPAVGDEFHIMAVAKVTRVHQSASEQGDDSRGVELQITDMSTMHEGEENEGDEGPQAEGSETRFGRAASKLYAKKA